jgi:hypothetical protein
LCRTIQLIQLNQPDSALQHIENTSTNEFSENDIEAFFLLAVCYQALGAHDKVEQLKRHLDSLLQSDSSGLAHLQQMALQQADNFALPPLVKAVPAAANC